MVGEWLWVVVGGGVVGGKGGIVGDRGGAVGDDGGGGGWGGGVGGGWRRRGVVISYNHQWTELTSVH